jgi:hypothetical protein
MSKRFGIKERARDDERHHQFHVFQAKLERM